MRFRAVGWGGSPRCVGSDVFLPLVGAFSHPRVAHRASCRRSLPRLGPPAVRLAADYLWEDAAKIRHKNVFSKFWTNFFIKKDIFFLSRLLFARNQCKFRATPPLITHPTTHPGMRGLEGTSPRQNYNSITV